MKQEYLDAYRRAHGVHHELVQYMIQLEHAAKNTVDLEDLADLAYVAREIHKHFDEIRKDAQRLADVCAKAFTLVWISDANAPAQVETEYCVVKPNPKTHARVPHPTKEPEKYHDFMTYMGVSEEQIARGVLRVGWDELSEELTRLQQEGKPMPPGINPEETYIEHRLSVRLKKKLIPESSGNGAHDGQDEERF